MIRRLALLVLLLVAFGFSVPYVVGTPAEANSSLETISRFLPQLFGPDDPPRIFVPYFENQVVYARSAIHWFGKVNRDDNYTDIRVGFNDEELNINLAVFDRLLWYRQNPTSDTLDEWDSASLYLSINEDPSAPGGDLFRFDGQLSNREGRDPFDTAFAYSGSGWISASIPFTTTVDWWGDAPNNDNDDRGWQIRFHIPFQSLGLNGPPALNSSWRVGIVIHDRDGAQPGIRESAWPENMDPTRHKTWGKLIFGLPQYTPPPARPGGTVTIQHGFGGNTVVDGMVGGGAICGSGTDFWTEWGDKNYAGADQVNIQNQGNTEDWPCFSKFYLSFPLDSLPEGKVILSARLTLHQFGNSDPTQARPSLIQVLLAESGWEESELTWNNAPAPVVNVSQAWVDPLAAFPGWPGVSRTWDLSYALSEVYPGSDTLHLVMYSADAPLHSGKYFSSSDVLDWNAAARPELTVEWGDPN